MWREQPERRTLSSVLRNLSLTSARPRAPADFRRWVLGGISLTIVGYTIIAALSLLQSGVHRKYAPILIGVTCCCVIALVLAARGRELAGGVMALIAVWFETQIGFLLDPLFPSPGMLVLPVLITGIGLLLGTRVALVATVVTIISTVVAQYFGSLTDSGFTADSVYWLVMFAIAIASAWTLLSLSLSGFTAVFRELTSSEMDLADTIRFAPDGVLILDDAQRVVLANPSAESIFDRVRSGLTGTAISELLPGHSEVLRDFAVAGDEIGGGPTLTTLTTILGTVRQVEVTWRRMERGRVQFLLRDVSDRMQAESRRQDMETQLAHAQRLEAVGQLAGGLSHDFNNILTAVSGSAELLRDELDPVEREALLDEIVAARDRGAALTHQLLAFARREVVQPRVIDVATHILGLQRLLQRVAGDRVRMLFTLAPQCRVRVDPGQFEQSLVNLVSNARDAMPDGGDCSITVDTDATDTTNERIRVCVSDSGAGMTEEVAARAFEPFFTTKSRGQGTGLGLAAVHGMALQSGGDVRIISARGRGTSVCIELPRVEDPIFNGAQLSAESPTWAGPATILVAEDDDGTRRIVDRILRRAGYRVLLAADGLAAWQNIVAADTAIDLLLTDVMMPGLTGPALAARVHERLPSLPIVFMTGYAEEFVRTLGTDQLEGDVLAKPFTADALTAYVATALLAARGDKTPGG